MRILMLCLVVGILKCQNNVNQTPIPAENVTIVNTTIPAPAPLPAVTLNNTTNNTNPLPIVNQPTNTTLLNTTIINGTNATTPAENRTQPTNTTLLNTTIINGTNATTPSQNLTDGTNTTLFNTTIINTTVPTAAVLSANSCQIVDPNKYLNDGFTKTTPSFIVEMNLVNSTCFTAFKNMLGYFSNFEQAALVNAANCNTDTNRCFNCAVYNQYLSTVINRELSEISSAIGTKLVNERAPLSCLYSTATSNNLDSLSTQNITGQLFNYLTYSSISNQCTARFLSEVGRSLILRRRFICATLADQASQGNKDNSGNYVSFKWTYGEAHNMTRSFLNLIDCNAIRDFSMPQTVIGVYDTISKSNQCSIRPLVIANTTIINATAIPVNTTVVQNSTIINSTAIPASTNIVQNPAIISNSSVPSTRRLLFTNDIESDILGKVIRSLQQVNDSSPANATVEIVDGNNTIPNNTSVEGNDANITLNNATRNGSAIVGDQNITARLNDSGRNATVTVDNITEPNNNTGNNQQPNTTSNNNTSLNASTPSSVNASENQIPNSSSVNETVINTTQQPNLTVPNTTQPSNGVVNITNETVINATQQPNLTVPNTTQPSNVVISNTTGLSVNGTDAQNLTNGTSPSQVNNTEPVPVLSGSLNETTANRTPIVTNGTNVNSTNNVVPPVNASLPTQNVTVINNTINETIPSLNSSISNNSLPVTNATIINSTVINQTQPNIALENSTNGTIITTGSIVPNITNGSAAIINSSANTFEINRVGLDNELFSSAVNISGLAKAKNNDLYNRLADNINNTLLRVNLFDYRCMPNGAAVFLSNIYDSPRMINFFGNTTNDVCTSDYIIEVSNNMTNCNNCNTSDLINNFTFIDRNLIARSYYFASGCLGSNRFIYGNWVDNNNTLWQVYQHNEHDWNSKCINNVVACAGNNGNGTFCPRSNLNAQCAADLNSKCSASGLFNEIDNFKLAQRQSISIYPRECDFVNLKLNPNSTQFTESCFTYFANNMLRNSILLNNRAVENIDSTLYNTTVAPSLLRFLQAANNGQQVIFTDTDPTLNDNVATSVSAATINPNTIVIDGATPTTLPDNVALSNQVNSITTPSNTQVTTTGIITRLSGSYINSGFLSIIVVIISILI